MTEEQLPYRDASRGAATRRRLVDAAVRVFASRGFHAVSTRELATAAAANQAAIPYYFGGKEGLYRAAAQQIADAGRAAFAPLLEEIARTPLEAMTREGLARVVQNVFACLTNGCLSESESHRAAFIVREHAQPGLAFDVLYEGYVREVHEVLTRIVAIARGVPVTSPEAVVEAHALIGTALGFLVARQVLVRRAGWETLTKEREEAIGHVVGNVVCRALGLSVPLPSRTGLVRDPEPEGARSEIKRDASHRPPAKKG